MKHALLLAAAALLAPAWAQAEPVRLQARDSVTLPFPGALAVFAVDPSIVEPSVRGGEVVLFARRAGETLVTVVLPAGAETLHVHVDPAPSLVPPPSGIGAQARGGSWESHYDSGTRRTESTLSLPFGDSSRSMHLQLDALHDPLATDTPSVVLPWASVAFETPGTSLVLLDQLVEQSPLTLDGRVLRGLHLRSGGLELHAGIASDHPFGDLLVPGSGDRALGLSWRAPAGGITLVPRLLWLPDSGTSIRGVGALGIEGGSNTLTYKGELGWSARPGAAVEIDLHSPERQVWARAGFRPRDFAALSSAAPAGTNADAIWTEKPDERTTATLSASIARLQLASSEPRSDGARLDLRRVLANAWSASASAGFGNYRGVAADAVRQQTLSLGLAYEAAGFGAAATLRHQQSSAAAQGGFGARLSAHAANEGWRGNFFLDAEQQAATIDLLLEDRPDLRRALAELGIPLSDPAELLRQLRDNAGLLQDRGITLGPLRVQPMRWQAGGQIAWQGAGPARPQLGLRLNGERVEGAVGGHASVFATLYASWRVLPDTELSLSYSRWQDRRDAMPAYNDQSVQVSLRTALSGQAFPGEGSHAIAGRVTREEAAGDQPLAGVEVVLDRSRRTTTDGTGRFVFDRPGAGQHRVEAMLPAAPGAVFTTPSVLTLAPGADVRFGIAVLGVRLTGVVRNDAGQPVGGVRVRLEGANPATTSTDSSGVYRFAAAEGEVRVTLDPDSLPAGYELGALAPRSRRLTREQPASVNFSVRAQRSIQGEVTGPGHEGAVVAVMELEREFRADAAGRFVLRRLPPGTLTLVVRTARGEQQHSVELPDGPVALRGVSLPAP